MLAICGDNGRDRANFSLGVREHFPVEWQSSEAEPLIRPIARARVETELEPALKRVDLIKGNGNQRVVIAKVIVTVWKRLSRTTRTANNNKITIIALATIGAASVFDSNSNSLGLLVCL